MDDWAATDMPSVMPILADQNTGILIARIMNELALAAPTLLPAAQAIEGGIDTVPFAFHDPGRKKIRELIIDVVMSELGFAALRGSTVTGGLFYATNRHSVSTYPVMATLINQFSVSDGFHATMSRDDLASSVEVFVYPTSQDINPVDLFRLDGSSTLILPFGVTTFHLPFRAVDRPSEPIAALELLPIEAYTDYRLNLLGVGTGTDITPALRVEGVRRRRLRSGHPRDKSDKSGGILNPAQRPR